MAEQYSQPTSDVTSDDKLWGLLSYILTPIVPIIVLLMEDKKNRPFLRTHAVQALAWGVVWYLLGIILSATVILSCVGLPLIAIAWIAAIYWGIQAYQGKEVTIPVVTNFVKSRGWA